MDDAEGLIANSTFKKCLKCAEAMERLKKTGEAREKLIKYNWLPN